MKASLITIKSLYNYGAVLQRFALFQYLKSNLNMQVQVIDYYPRVSEESGFSLKYILMKLLTIGKRRKINKFNKTNLICTNVCYKKFEELKKNLPISDIYIVGSDQVWNSQISKGSLDPAFFLAFIHNKKKISYASSIGREDVSLTELKDMREYLSDFADISVREESAKQLLNSVGLENVKVVLDPVFLIEKKDYEKFIRPVPYKKYLLIYSLEKKPIIEKMAQEISKKRGLQIIEIGNFRPKYSSDKYLQNIGVEDFLSLFNFADFIITSSMHGTAFSILLNKQFVSIEPSIRKTRLGNILNIFALSERLITEEDDYVLDDLLRAINYNEVNRLVDIESEKSRNFLKDAIGLKDYKKQI